MTLSFDQENSELIRRRVLLAVALVDPITGDLVSRGVKVSVDKLAGRPILNRSGYFVWLAEDDVRPTEVTVEPDGAPFEAQTAKIKPPPDPPPENLLQPTTPVEDGDEERLTRVFLRPTADYPFPDSAIVLRGQLRETRDENSPLVPNAFVVLEWKSYPPPPPPPPAPPWPRPYWRRSPAVAQTDASGEFGAALVLPAGAKADAGDKLIVLRLRVQREDKARVSDEIPLPPDVKPDEKPSAIQQRNVWFLTKPLALE
jgi:hypothetical protein